MFVFAGYSVITGFGFGMMYIPSVVGVAPYFTERRALAIGICLCGSGVGTFELAPISQQILDKFGLRWVFRTFAKICLFCVLCGSTMAPVHKQEEEIQQQNIRRSGTQNRGLTKKALGMLLGEDLACSKSLSVFTLVVLAVFLYCHLHSLHSLTTTC